MPTQFSKTIRKKINFIISFQILFFKCSNLNNQFYLLLCKGFIYVLCNNFRNTTKLIFIEGAVVINLRKWSLSLVLGRPNILVPSSISCRIWPKSMKSVKASIKTSFQSILFYIQLCRLEMAHLLNKHY